MKFVTMLFDFILWGYIIFRVSEIPIKRDALISSNQPFVIAGIFLLFLTEAVLYKVVT